MKPFLVVSLTCTLVVSATAAQMPPVTDAQFVIKASAANALEVEEGKLAVERASDPKLKEFASKMIADHGAAQESLQEAARIAGVPASLKLDEVRRSMVDNLSSRSGVDFDRIYQADQVQAHAEAVALLSDYQASGRNSQLKSWAETTLETVKMHRATINAMP